MIKIGITGGIGSGKTTVVRMFQSFGVPAYIADKEAKKLMNRSPLKEEIIHVFGESSYDYTGILNRAYLSERVFRNPSLLKKLNSIVHPRVETDFENWSQKQTAHYGLYEAAILFETGKYKKMDYNILVKAPESIRIERVQKRDHTSIEKIKSRIQNQWPDEQKEALADWTIINLKIKETRNVVSKLHEIFSNL